MIKMERKIKKEYNPFVACMKGLAIFSVVLGHCSQYFNGYVNMYHIAVFFFIAGYSYNWNKYEKAPELLIGTRLHTFMKSYIPYMLILGLLHNSFWRMGIMPAGVEPYGRYEFIARFFRYFMLDYEPLCGAVWFMAPWLIAVAYYGLIAALSYKIADGRKYCITAAICIVFGLFGVWMLDHGLIQGYRNEIALLFMPVIALGGGTGCMK